MKSFKCFLTLLCLLACCLAHGQADTLRYAVRGSVVDAGNGKPLSYVAVSLPGTNYATVTNQDGDFVIKSDLPPRFIAFSLLGYKVLTLPADRDQAMRVSLTRGEYTLDPAQVISGDPLTLLREAIYKIPDNCPSEPELFDCFYRETAQKRSRFIYVSEAVTQTYKTPISSIWGKDLASVVKSRLLTSPRKSDTLGVKVLGGPVMAADYDLVKTRGAVLDMSEMDNYSYELLPSEEIRQG